MNFFQSKIILAAVAWLALASPAMGMNSFPAVFFFLYFIAHS